MRILIAGLLVGLVVGVALAALIRPVSHDIVPSLSRVDERGRNETFQIVLPTDRLYAAGAGVEGEPALPVATARAEVFQLRDARDRVIGLASRLADGTDSDWVLYMPARGALFLRDTGSEPAADGSSTGIGRVLGGTETFADERGQFRRTETLTSDERRIRFDTAMQAILP